MNCHSHVRDQESKLSRAGDRGIVGGQSIMQLFFWPWGHGTVQGISKKISFLYSLSTDISKWSMVFYSLCPPFSSCFVRLEKGVCINVSYQGGEQNGGRGIQDDNFSFLCAIDRYAVPLGEHRLFLIKVFQYLSVLQWQKMEGGFLVHSWEKTWNFFVLLSSLETLEDKFEYGVLRLGFFFLLASLTCGVVCLEFRRIE